MFFPSHLDIFFEMSKIATIAEEAPEEAVFLSRERQKSINLQKVINKDIIRKNGKVRQYFYADNTRALIGPCTRSHLKELFISKQIDGHTLVWTKKQQGWAKISALPSLLAVLQIEEQFPAGPLQQEMKNTRKLHKFY
jgi:hypothetical protein